MTSGTAIIEMMPGISPGIYDAKDFQDIADIVYAEAGIVLPAWKAMLVYSRIAPLVRNSGSGTFAAYIRLLNADPGELRRAIGALTTNHTFFFREAHHFAHFAQEVRPTMLRALNAGQSRRLWTAGCSSGEETWSLIMTLLGEDRYEGRQVARSNVRVLASDIAGHVLRTASEGTYLADALDHVPEKLRHNWMEEVANTASITEEARRIVRFHTLNLQGEWPTRVHFDAIFCRNVMIYFDQATKERLVARLAERLTPGGYLYIGHSEQATGPAARMLEAVGPTIYRRRPN